MGMASGRAWLSAGQSLNNIGELLLRNQELERERQRQAEQDAIAAADRARLIARQDKQDQIAEGERFRQAGRDATSDAIELAKLRSTTGLAPILPTRAAPAAAGMAPQITAIGQTAVGAQPGYQKVGLSAPERTAQRNKDDAYNTMASLAGTDPAGFGRLPWKQQLNLAGDNTAYDNWRAIQTAQERARRGANPRPKTPQELREENRRQRDQLMQESAAATATATKKYGPLDMPMIGPTAADTAAFAADTNDINTMNRDVRALRDAGRRLPGGSNEVVGRVLGQRQVVTADQRAYLESIGAWDPDRYEVRP